MVVSCGGQGCKNMVSAKGLNCGECKRAGCVDLCDPFGIMKKSNVNRNKETVARNKAIWNMKRADLSKEN